MAEWVKKMKKLKILIFHLHTIFVSLEIWQVLVRIGHKM